MFAMVIVVALLHYTTMWESTSCTCLSQSLNPNFECVSVWVDINITRAGPLPSALSFVFLVSLVCSVDHPCKVSALSLLHAFIKVCCLVIPTTSCVCVLTQLSSIHVHLSPSHFVPHTLAIGHSLPSLHTYHHCPISAIFTHTYVSLPFLLMQWGTVTHGWLKQE